MSNYFSVLGRYLLGWFRFSKIEKTLGWKEGWGPTSIKWILTYLFNIGINVLTGGAVQTLSARMHLHRDGWVNDKVLDILDKFDPGHGEKAMPPLWDTVESSRSTQIVATTFWVILLCLVSIK